MAKFKHTERMLSEWYVRQIDGDLRKRLLQAMSREELRTNSVQQVADWIEEYHPGSDRERRQLKQEWLQAADDLFDEADAAKAKGRVVGGVKRAKLNAQKRKARNVKQPTKAVRSTAADRPTKKRPGKKPRRTPNQEAQETITRAKRGKRRLAGSRRP